MKKKNQQNESLNRATKWKQERKKRKTVIKFRNFFLLSNRGRYNCCSTHIVCIRFLLFSQIFFVVAVYPKFIWFVEIHLVAFLKCVTYPWTLRKLVIDVVFHEECIWYIRLKDCRFSVFISHIVFYCIVLCVYWIWLYTFVDSPPFLLLPCHAQYTAHTVYFTSQDDIYECKSINTGKTNLCKTYL